LKVDLMGKDYVAEGLVKAFTIHELEATRILLPRAAVARDLVPFELRQRGAKVDVVDAYRTVLPDHAKERALEIFGAARKPDWITFTSTSTVQNFVSVAGAETLAGVKVASIGPITTRTARELGIEVTAEARKFTIDGLVEAMLASLQV
jgi:uroporphyrinogen III methyltransferase/synthase